MKKSVIIDILIVILIITAGIFVRISGEDLALLADTTAVQLDQERLPALKDEDSYLHARRALQLDEATEQYGIGVMEPVTFRSEDALMSQVSSEEDWITLNGLPMIAVLVHKVTGGSMWKLIYCIGVAIAPLAAVPAYIFVRRRTNVFGGTCAGLLTAFATAYVEHSSLGYFEADAAIPVLAMTGMCAMAESALSRNLLSQCLWAFAGLAAITVLAGVSDTYYIYMVLAILAAGLAFTAKKVCVARETRHLAAFGIVIKEYEGKKVLAESGVYAAPTKKEARLLSIKKRINSHKDSWLAAAIIALFGLISCFTVGQLTIGISTVYEEIFSSINEISALPLIAGGILDTATDGVINMQGGIVVILTALFVMFMLMVLSFKRIQAERGDLAWIVSTGRADSGRSITYCGERADISKGEGDTFILSMKKPVDGRTIFQTKSALLGTTVFCLIWLAVTTPLALRSASFVQLPALPVAVIAGLGVGMAAQELLGSMKTAPAILAASVMIAAIVFCPCLGARELASSSHTFVSGVQYEIAQWMDSHISNRSSVLSWKDYGYFYELEGDSRMLADGGTFDEEYLYWVARALTTKNPKESGNICRMLQFGGLDARYYLQSLIESGMIRQSDDTETPEAFSMVLLESLMKYDRVKAGELLCKNFSLDEDMAKLITSKTHPLKQDNVYALVEPYMLKNAAEICYYAKIDSGGRLPLAAMTEEPLSLENGQRVIAPMTGIDDCYAELQKDSIGNLAVSIVHGDGSQYNVLRNVHLQRGTLISDMNYSDALPASGDLVLYIAQYEEKYNIFVCSPVLADSMLVELAFSHGAGMSEFVRVCGNGSQLWQVRKY